MNLNELSNVELLYHIAESDEALAKELASRLELCVCEYIDGNTLLNRSYHYCNDVSAAVAAVKTTIKNDGEILGYLPMGEYKAPREVGKIIWED